MLRAILHTFNFSDADELALDNFPLTTLEEAYTEMVLPSEKREDQCYNIKNFLRTRLKPAFKLLFDVVHRVFLLQTVTNEQVIVEKFKLMVAVYKNLHISWARVLLSSMKDEVKKVISKFDDKGLLKEFNVKRRLNLCIKILQIILANFARAVWDGFVFFDQSKRLPTDQRQFKMAQGINSNIILSASLLAKPFLINMAKSNLEWTEPQAKGKQPVRSPLAKKCDAPASSSQAVMKKKIVSQTPLRSLRNKPDDDVSISLDQSPSGERSNALESSTQTTSTPL